ncbi:MAG: hypothetical protein Q8T08_16500, partial [Ignavibacteria bacterium]|nr:hypothetical protein [Ignavibacteria bacterium]
MKNLLFTIVLLLVFASCTNKKTETTKADEIVKIENLLEKYMIAIENEDYQMIENIWYPGDSSMLLGTDSKDRLMGWENIRQAYRKQFNVISDTYIS